MGVVEDKGKSGVRARTILTKKVLRIVSFKKCPHRAYVKKLVKKKVSSPS